MRINMEIGFGRKVYETIKFVLTAILIAVLMVAVSQIKSMSMLLWKYWTEVDRGYMWTINIVVAAAVTKIMFIKQKGAIMFTLKCASTFILAILVECILWHRKDIWSIISPQITLNRIMLSGAGIFAATLAFIFHIKGIDYGDDENKKKVAEDEDYDSAE